MCTFEDHPVEAGLWTAKDFAVYLNSSVYYAYSLINTNRVEPVCVRVKSKSRGRSVVRLYCARELRRLADGRPGRGHRTDLDEQSGFVDP